MLDLLYPPRCPLCDDPVPVGVRGPCADCDEWTPRIEVPPCPDGTPRYAAAAFEGGLRDALLGLKFGGRTWLARPLGRWAASRLGDVLEHFDLVVPVPLHRPRLRRRGYNQSGLIAGHLGRAGGLPVSYRALSRIDRGAARATVGLGARPFAPGAFVATSVSGRRVALVDDVTTTGHTGAACASALREAGAAAVAVFAVAYTLPSEDSTGLLDGGAPS